MSSRNLNEYYLEYQKYKEGNYQFGKYSREDQIAAEFFKGKIFVLKGGLSVVIWILTIWMFVMASVSLYAVLFTEYGIFIMPFILTLSMGLLLILNIRRFVVIGPLGVYYRKVLNSGTFSWDRVSVTGSLRMYRGSTWAEVTIHLFYRRKIKFRSNNYLNKEFKRKYKKELFFALFDIYSQLGKKQISKPSTEKSFPYSQMKETIQSSVKMKDLLDKVKQVLVERQKNDEEYKMLLARKAEGESVEELIKQNRNEADILAQRDREQSEEAMKWGRSEEGQKLFKFMDETRRLNPRLSIEEDIKRRQRLQIIKEINKNEKEYEELLERKINGEFVNDLIKQNRYIAEILAEQYKKVK